MSVLEKIKNNKRYKKKYNTSKVLMFIPLFILLIITFSGFQNALSLISSDLKLKKINQDIELIEKDSNKKKKIDLEYKNDIIKEKENIIVLMSELEEKEKNNKKMSLLIITIFVLIVTMMFISRNKYNKTILKKEDFIELLNIDKIYEKQYIDYMNTINIHDLFEDNNHLKEIHGLINEKDWLLKRVKNSKLFKELLNKNEFKEYLSLFNEDYIKEYFKEEIDVIKKENKSINFLLNEKSEKEIFQIINI